VKYSIVYADPPWSYDDKALSRGGAERHYRTMSLEDICALPVGGIAADDCLLFMWGAWPKLYESGKVIESFDSFWGMGRWTRANTEFCLLAVKGKPKRESAAVHQLIYAPVSEHPRKPDEARERIIKLAGDLPRVELFARRAAPGWDLWGNEVKCDIAL
jgi:N6-adenosine-specific RNA methylase IME4